jgi:competence protein ComEC
MLRCLLVLLLISGWSAWRWPRPAANDPARLAPRSSIELRGVLVARLQPLPLGGCRSRLQLELPWQGRTELIFSNCAALQEGWRLALRGQLQRPAPALHPLLGDGGARLANQGVFSRLSVQQVQVLDRGQGPVIRLRQHLSTQLQAAGGKQGGPLLAALVMGSAVVSLPEQLQSEFRAAGLSHALAASGFHLTVLLGLVMLLARRAPAPLRLLAGLAAMAVFLLLAGPQPSVLRSLLMGSAALLIGQTNQTARPLGLLGASLALLLLWQPAWLLDVGFQLSAAATAGLLISAPALERRIGAALAVPLAAWLWTLPLQLLNFGVVPLYAVPANLLATPLVTLLTLGAMLAALFVLLLPPLVAPLVGLLQLPIWLLVQLVHHCAQLPLALLLTGRPEPLLVLLFSLGMAPWLLPLRRWRPWGAGLLLLAVLVQLQALLRDQLLLVHQGRSSLLLVRHQGRGALISTSADAFSCARARRLQQGSGLPRLDWLVLLDPVAPTDPSCWQQLSDQRLVLPQGRLQSPGLSYTSFGGEGRGGVLQFGSKRVALVPQPRGSRPAELPRTDALWLGMAAPAAEQAAWQRWAAAKPVLVSGAGSGPANWRFSGEKGFLQGW